MKIYPLTNYANFRMQNFENKNHNSKCANANCSTPNKNINFGWCEPHQVRKSEVSILFNEKLRVKQKELELKRKMGELLDVANRSAMEATKFVINFANKMKGEAEFVPLWAVKTTPELQQTLDESPIFGDPVQNLIGLKNIGKFKLNNPNYSEALNNQGAGSLQVHTSIIFVEQAERNMDKADLTDEEKTEAKELISIVKKKIDEVFGDGTYAKLIEISNMGKEPTLEQKIESNRILKEIDSKAKNFDFGEEYNLRLEALLDKLHLRFHHEHEHVHHHHDHEQVNVDSNVEIIYHTHGPNGEHVHEHHHEHEHEHIHHHD